MKILIISSGRTGSTSLIHGLHASKKDAIKKFEPFNKDLYFENFDFPNHLNYISNINQDTLYLEKNQIQDPVKYKHIWISALQQTYFFPCEKNEIWVSPKIGVEVFINYSQNFDKVILLGRQNLKESAISLAHVEKHLIEPYNKYTFDKKIDYKNELKLIKQRHKQLLKLSKLLNISITWYEDLFSGSKHYLNYFLEKNNIQVDNLELFYSYFNPKNRYRQE